jgi:hypothetical protein
MLIVLPRREGVGLESPVTVAELDEALKSCICWIIQLIEGRLPDNFRTALIWLLPKKGDMSQIKNWRPISLLSYFYKINLKAMNIRLAKVIDKLTYLNQKACNKKDTYRRC